MNAKLLRTLVAVLVIGLGGTMFAGYVSSAYDWSIFEDGWTLLADDTPDIDDPLFEFDLDLGRIHLPEVEMLETR